MRIDIRPYQAEDRDRLINLFRDSVRRVARRDYSHEQVRAWAPDDIDAEGFGRRRADKATFVAVAHRAVAGGARPPPPGQLDPPYLPAPPPRQGRSPAPLRPVGKR